MTNLLFVLGAYLIGSVPFAIISSRIFKLADPRSYGSGNPGATNVLRSGNKAAALSTLLGDAFKGWLAVWLAAKLGVAAGADAWIAAACGFAAFFGHVFPVFIGFRGGKGVATALGVERGLGSSGIHARTVAPCTGHGGAQWRVISSRKSSRSSVCSSPASATSNSSRTASAVWRKAR